MHHSRKNPLILVKPKWWTPCTQANIIPLFQFCQFKASFLVLYWTQIGYLLRAPQISKYVSWFIPSKITNWRFIRFNWFYFVLAPYLYWTMSVHIVSMVKGQNAFKPPNSRKLFLYLCKTRAIFQRVFESVQLVPTSGWLGPTLLAVIWVWCDMFSLSRISLFLWYPHWTLHA